MFKRASTRVQRETRKSYEILMPLAREGNAQAQSAVGYLLSKGLGVKRNRESAVYWYKQAASQSNTTAQFNLGMAYVKGRGVRMLREEVSEET